MRAKLTLLTAVAIALLSTGVGCRHKAQCCRDSGVSYAPPPPPPGDCCR